MNTGIDCVSSRVAEPCSTGLGGLLSLCSPVSYFMEKALSPVVVVADAQPRRSGFGDDPPAQRLDLGRLALARRVALPPSGAGNLLKRPADKLDGAFHSGAILLRPAQPRQFHQRRQLVQAGAQGAWILCHYPPTGTAGEGFGIRR
jgi:hypothetical protein